MSDGENNKPSQPLNGGRNLIILGLVSITIVAASTAMSLYIYRSTGDIYLDRSRPGFIIEKDDAEPVKETIHRFSSDGDVTKETYDEYLHELNTIIDNLADSEDSFSETPLSDDSLKVTVNDDDVDD